MQGPAWDGKALRSAHNAGQNWFTIVIEIHPLTGLGGVGEVTVVQPSRDLRLLHAQGPGSGGPYQQPVRSIGMNQTRR